MGNNNDAPNPPPIQNQKSNIDNDVKNDKNLINKRDEIFFQRRRNNTEIQKIERKNNYDLNIYVYSDQDVNKSLIKLLDDFNSPIIKCKTKIINNYSKENSNEIINIFKEDYRQNKFKNVLIIPINSILDFINSIGIFDNKKFEEKNIFHHFNKLNREEHPFYMFIDYEETDFLKENETIEKDCFLKKYYQLKRDDDKDYDISFEINIKKEDNKKIEILKNILLKKKKNKDDFEISINEKYFYQNLFEEENKNLDIFLSDVFEDIAINIFKISLVLINQNSDFLEELREYEKLEREIIKINFIYYSFKNNKIIDAICLFGLFNKRNFTIKRSKKFPKNQLLKYTSFYNHFDQILYCEQNAYIPFKINIGFGGFIGSGKSTLINTILKEKKCPEEKMNNKNDDNFYEYTKRDSGLNFIEFPGFNSKLDYVEKEINKIKYKISQMKEKKEKLHCFIFCVNYKDNLLEENQLINKIFEALFQINTKIFFVITQSEKSDSEGFKQLKGNIIEILENIKKKYSKNVIDTVLGEDIENQIIPILSVKKKIKEKNINQFGLDELFTQLYNYFSLKMIKNIHIDEEEDNDRQIQKKINEDFLLKIFKSKNDLIEALEKKMKYESNKFFLKALILNPKYLNNFSIDIIGKLYDKVFDQFLIIYKKYIDKLKEEEKLRFYKLSKIPRVKQDEIVKIFENPEFETMKNGLIEIKDFINNPLIDKFSTEISNLIINQFFKIIKEKSFSDFFVNIITNFNMAILYLNIISIYYKELYKENEKEKEEK